MGQSAFSCNIEQPLSSELLERELKIYRWRADPNSNTHIPKVTFKSARSQKEEEKFAQFLKTQAEKEYLEIYKFQQQA